MTDSRSADAVALEPSLVGHRRANLGQADTVEPPEWWDQEVEKQQFTLASRIEGLEQAAHKSTDLVCLVLVLVASAPPRGLRPRPVVQGSLEQMKRVRAATERRDHGHRLLFGWDEEVW
jgi:hypothetical protein